MSTSSPKSSNYSFNSNDMKLSYRGLSYEYEPTTTDIMDGEIGGKYRGQNWTARYPRHIPVPQSDFDLKYRGVEYRSGSTANSSVAAPPPTAPSQRLSPLDVRHIIDSEVAKVHRANICRSLERRMQAAQERGDRNLLNMLETELQQLTCLVR